MADAHSNFAYSTVATAPSPATSGTSLTVASGDGAKFPTPPFNATIWPASAQPLSSNAEIVRVTAISTDTLTITRAQETSTARTVIVTDQIAATITAKTLTDVEATRYKGAWSGANYVPGDLVTYQDKLFVCSSTVSSASSFVGTTTVAPGDGGSARTVSLPAGSLAGDIGVIINGDYSVSVGAAPSGWTVLKTASTGVAAYNVSWKALSSGDITAGTITIPIQPGTTPSTAIGIWVFRSVTVDATNTVVATSTNSVPVTVMTNPGYLLELESNGGTKPTGLGSSSGFSSNGDTNTSIAGGYESYSAGVTTSRSFTGAGSTSNWTIAVPLSSGSFPSGSFIEIAVDKTPAMRMSTQSLFR